MTFLIDAHHVGARQTGNETWARNIAREIAMIARPGEVEFAAAAGGADELRSLTGQAPRLVSGSSARRLAIDLPRIARRIHAGAVLVQYTMPLSRVPCVVAVHDLSVEEPEARQWLPTRTRLRIRASIRSSARRAAHLLATSEFTKDDMVRRYGIAEDRVSVVPAAVDPKLAQLLAAAEDAPARARASFEIIAVGGVLPRKNLVVLGRAVAALRPRVDARLRIVGTVGLPGQPIARELTELLGDALTITGYVTIEELAAHYGAADVLAFPSLYEGFGIPVVEAMTAGVPVVVSDRTSLPEVVVDAGVVVSATDPVAWTNALRRLHDDPSWRAGLVDRGRQRAASYDWRSAAETTLAVLRRVSR